MSRTKIFHVATTGSDDHPGTSGKPLRTIQRAADLAMPGDAVIVHEGLYRERVNPPRGGESDDQRITYMAAEGEAVEIRGSEIITGWERIAADTWKATLPNTFFGNFNPYGDVIDGEWYIENKFPRHTGAVYLHGVWHDEAETLEQVLAPAGDRPLWKAEVGEKDTMIWAQFPGVDPNAEEVEINVRQSVFYPDRPGRNYITVRGFIMRHAATPWAGAMSEQVGLIGTHWSKGWVIEENIISHSVGTGVTLGRCALDGPMPPATAEGYVESIEQALADGWSREKIGSHVVRNNHISHCEKNGIHGSLGGIFSLIEGNMIHDIALRGWLGGHDICGLKLLGSHDTIIRNNHIFRCGTTGGVWLDWMAQGTRMTGNLLHDNTHDLFVEVNHGPFLIDHNLFLSNRSLLDWSEGGAYVHNLFAGKMELHADPDRMTPFHKAHSTELAGMSRIACGDDRFFNNVFSGASCSISLYDEKEEMRMTGNLYLLGAKPGRHDQDALVVAEADSGFVLKEEHGEWKLRLPAGQAWAGSSVRKMVTSNMLGTTRISGLLYEQPDGSSYRLDVDYLGVQRTAGAIAPGPFAFPAGCNAAIKVWPKV